MAMLLQNINFSASLDLKIQLRIHEASSINTSQLEAFAGTDHAIGFIPHPSIVPLVH